MGWPWRITLVVFVGNAGLCALHIIQRSWWGSLLNGGIAGWLGRVLWDDWRARKRYSEAMRDYEKVRKETLEGWRNGVKSEPKSKSEPS